MHEIIITATSNMAPTREKAELQIYIDVWYRGMHMETSLGDIDLMLALKVHDL